MRVCLTNNVRAFQDLFSNLNDAVLSRASAEGLVVDMKHPAVAPPTPGAAGVGSGAGGGGGFPQIKTDMMSYSHAAAAAAAGIPVSAGGSPGSGLGHSRLHQVMFVSLTAEIKSYFYMPHLTASRAYCKLSLYSVADVCVLFIREGGRASVSNDDQVRLRMAASRPGNSSGICTHSLHIYI